MAILSKYKLEKYQYGIDVRKHHQLYGLSGKIIYDGQWRLNKDDRIIVVEMNETIAEREAHFYLEVNGHNNIIRTLGYVENTSNLTIFIQEFAQQGDLADILMDNQFNITQSTLVEMFEQISDAMTYIASKNIVHGDLGCRNVLVFRVDPFEPKNNLVKLTDFGLARWTHEPPTTDEDSTIIPIRYCAPEILRHKRHSSYSEKSDVYSMGVLIWEALSNSEIPYSSVAEDDEVKQMKIRNGTLPRPSICDRQLWHLMNECWHNDRQKRPNFDSIKNRLATMEVSEVSDFRSSVAIYEAPDYYEYELDTDVRMNDLLDGHFGQVYEAEWIGREERPIVLIVMDEEPSEYEALVYTDFEPHPYILYTYGFVGNDRGLTMLLQERTPHDNLQALLQSVEFRPSAKVLFQIFSQLIDAMSYVVSKGIIHGDLCCANVLVFQMDSSSDPSENLVKLTNFRSARRNDASFSDNRRLNIPVRYCSLEILRSTGRSNHSELSDVYSMGVLMWEALSKGKLPYDSSITNNEVRQRKLQGEKLPKPLVCDDRIWSIIEDCWHNEPQLRYVFKEMKIRFSHIDPNSLKIYRYELNANVKQKHPLDGSNGKFYEADLIPKQDPSVILLVLNEERADREASFYMKLNSHPHIIQTFDYVKNDLHSIMLLQERAPFGNLQRLLQSGDFHPSATVLVRIFLQIVDAMIYIAGQDIVHCDLRCGNVLVFQMDSSEPTNNRVKLTNFSMARAKDQLVTDNRLPDTSVRYCAPEILRSKDESSYSEKSDVYSMGVLMWEAYSKGKTPYGSRANDHDIRQQRLNNQKLSRLQECHSQIWSVIEDCWCNEPEIRYDFKELKQRISNVDLDYINNIHCDRCNKYILENEMDEHLESCPVKPTPSSVTMHFTRCTHCGERCLGSEIEEHLKSCPVKHPPVRQIFFARCDYCGEEYRDNEIVAHQDTCAARTTLSLDHEPVQFIRCPYCDNDYVDSEFVDHRKTCPSRPKTPVPKRQCRHCDLQYPLDEIENHEKTCLPRPVTPPTPLQIPVPSRQCRHCRQVYSSDDIDRHERSCPEKLKTPPFPPPLPIPSRQCQYCKQQHPLVRIQAHEASCPLKPKTCTEQLYASICCCCAKN